MTPGIDTEVHDINSYIVIALVMVLLALLGVVVKTYGQARAANTAVNNVGPGDHSLWDQVSMVREDVNELVRAQREFAERGWPTLPDDIATAAQLTATIRTLQHDVGDIKRTLDDHVRWEETQKYPRG